MASVLFDLSPYGAAAQILLNKSWNLSLFSTNGASLGILENIWILRAINYSNPVLLSAYAATLTKEAPPKVSFFE